MQRSREDSQADRPDPGSAVAEFVADHERVPEKNRASKGCSKVRSGARFMGLRRQRALAPREDGRFW